MNFLRLYNIEGQNRVSFKNICLAWQGYKIHGAENVFLSICLLEARMNMS